MKDKCYVCKITCNIVRENEQKACAFEHNGDENICPFDARYLDLSEHDKQIRAEVIDECKVIFRKYLSTREIEGLDKLLEQLKENK